MKIAVCLPSYNEAKNIQRSTKLIDDGLSKFFKDYDCYIVNADNNSPDKTNELFNMVNTKNKKVSLISKNLGKGYNLLNFFNFCKQNNINYAATIDSDVVSINETWVLKLIAPLIEDNADYVTPIYKRSRYEGSSTNHFVFPAIYAICNEYIRQPIAGDFAFSKKFVNMILNQNINESIKLYGIDIFMTMNACFNKLKIKQVVLGNKFHSPSFNKMDAMFKQILSAFIYVLTQNLDKTVKHKLSTDISLNIKSISNVRKFNHKKFALQKFKESKLFLLNKGIKINYKNIEDIYIQYFKKLIFAIREHSLSNNFIEIFEQLFFARATSFWIHSEYISAKTAEYEILNQTKKIFKEINL